MCEADKPRVNWMQSLSMGGLAMLVFYIIVQQVMDGGKVRSLVFGKSKPD